MIRILHVVDSLAPGGAETMIMNLYRRMDRSKIQFDFVIHTEKKEGFYDEIVLLGGRVYSVCRFTGWNLFQYLIWWDRFFREHQEYSIIHCHMRSCATLYMPIAKVKGVCVIAHSHSTSNGSGIQAIIKAVMQYPIRYLADYFFACSMESAIWLFGKGISNRDNCYILKNAIDVNRFAFSQADRDIYRKSMLIGEHQLLISHVGNFTDAKNHQFILDVFEGIIKRRDAKLVLVGSGTSEQVARVKRIIEKKGLQNRIILTGSRNDVEKFLCAADIFVFPSKWEGFGMAALEAQACGLPTYISDTIPKDVCVTELAHVLPIDRGSEVWVSEILNGDLQRREVRKELLVAGYDVQENAQWLKGFYVNLIISAYKH